MRLIDADSLIEDLELLAKHEENFRQSVILGVVHTIKARSTVLSDHTETAKYRRNFTAQKEKERRMNNGVCNTL